MENSNVIPYLQEFEVGNVHFNVQLESSYVEKLFKIEMTTDILKYVIKSGQVVGRYKGVIETFLTHFDVKHRRDEQEALFSKYQTSIKRYKTYCLNANHELENVLVNIVFQKIIPFDQQNVMESYYLLLFRFSLIKSKLLSVAVEREIITRDVVLIVQTFNKMFEHDENWLEILYGQFYKGPYNLESVLKKMIL